MAENRSQGGGGGGGTLIFSSYVGFGPGLPFTPTIYQEFQAPQKIIEILAIKKLSPILYLDLKKIRALKCIEMTPKYSLILWWPPKNNHKILIPQIVIIFLKATKNIEIQNF